MVVSCNVTQHLTFADIALFEAVNAVCNTYGVLKSLRPYPKLKEFHDKVASRARIEHHIATRPEGF
jgi:glutathione S-transferase